MADYLDVLRTEKKFSISKVTASEIAAKLSHIIQLDPHCANNRPYVVKSLYFDSLYNQDFQEKSHGLEIRKKIRLRTYGDADVVKLEIKQKQGAKQRKQSLPIRHEEAEALIAGDYRCLMKQENTLALELYAIMTERLYRPKSLVQYQRLAFMMPTNDIRITLDSDISALEDCKQFFAKRVPLYPIQSLDRTVLEIKYNHFLLDYLQAALSSFDLVESANSKYGSSRYFGLGVGKL